MHLWVLLCVVWPGGCTCGCCCVSHSPGGIKMTLSRLDSSQLQCHRHHTHTVVSPLPHIFHTHTLQGHTHTHSLTPPTQTGAMPPCTDLPTHTLSHIYTGPVQNHRNTYRCSQHAHRHTGTHWPCTHMHMYTLHILSCISKFSVPHLTHRKRKERLRITLLACTAS